MPEIPVFFPASLSLSLRFNLHLLWHLRCPSHTHTHTPWRCKPWVAGNYCHL